MASSSMGQSEGNGGEMGDWIDLLSEAVGGRVVACNDEFFAPASNLVRVEPPEWKEGLYTEQGKWMDGWETRRRRTPGHDWCVLALGIPGRIRSVTVDTAHFTGNFAPAASLEACCLDGDPVATTRWTEILPRVPLSGDQHHFLRIEDRSTWTHLRLLILSSNPQRGDAEHFRQAGADAFLSKSLRESCLTPILNQLISLESLTLTSLASKNRLTPVVSRG